MREAASAIFSTAEIARAKTRAELGDIPKRAASTWALETAPLLG
jgi:hypothetical protein